MGKHVMSDADKFFIQQNKDLPIDKLVDATHCSPQEITQYLDSIKAPRIKPTSNTTTAGKDRHIAVLLPQGTVQADEDRITNKSKKFRSDRMYKMNPDEPVY